MSISINCDTEAKEKNREIIKDWLMQNYSANKLKKAKVICLPGWQGLEIYQIWDKVGVKRKNIIALTNEKDDLRHLKKIKNINSIYTDIFSFHKSLDLLDSKCCEMHSKELDYIKYRKTSKSYNVHFKKMVEEKKVDIIYFDIYGHWSIQKQCLDFYLALLKENGAVGFTWQLSREKCEVLKEYYRKIEKRKFKMNANPRIDSVLMTFQASINQLDIIGDLKLKTYTGEGLIFDCSDKKKFRELTKNGFHASNCLKTKYITDKGVPMGTLFFKLRKNKRFSPLKYQEKLKWKILESLMQETIEINIPKSRVKREKTKKHKSGLRMKKKLVIDYLKNFPEKNDLDDLAEISGYSKNQLRAFKAHITMGTY
jgi:hypothetical protein